MQIFYAAPFILISLVGFFLCLSRSHLRRFAYSALVAPVSFGFTSVLGLLVGGLLWAWLNLHRIDGLGVVLGCATYVGSGLMGAGAAIRFVRFAENNILLTGKSRALTLRLVISLLTIPMGFIVGLFIAETRLGPSSLEPAFELALVFGVLTGAFAYFTVQAIQDRQKPTSSAGGSSSGKL